MFESQPLGPSLVPYSSGSIALRLHDPPPPSPPSLPREPFPIPPHTCQLSVHIPLHMLVLVFHSSSAASTTFLTLLLLFCALMLPSLALSLPCDCQSEAALSDNLCLPWVSLTSSIQSSWHSACMSLKLTHDALTVVLLVYTLIRKMGMLMLPCLQCCLSGSWSCINAMP